MIILFGDISRKESVEFNGHLMGVEIETSKIEAMVVKTKTEYSSQQRDKDLQEFLSLGEVKSYQYDNLNTDEYIWYSSIPFTKNAKGSDLHF